MRVLALVIERGVTTGAVNRICHPLVLAMSSSTAIVPALRKAAAVLGQFDCVDDIPARMLRRHTNEDTFVPSEVVEVLGNGLSDDAAGV